MLSYTNTFTNYRLGVVVLFQVSIGGEGLHLPPPPSLPQHHDYYKESPNFLHNLLKIYLRQITFLKFSTLVCFKSKNVERFT